MLWWLANDPNLFFSKFKIYLHLALGRFKYWTLPDVHTAKWKSWSQSEFWWIQLACRSYLIKNEVKHRFAEQIRCCLLIDVLLWYIYVFIIERTIWPAVVLAEPPAELTVTAQTVVDIPLCLLIPQFLLKLQGICLLPKCIFLPAESTIKHVCTCNQITHTTAI